MQLEYENLKEKSRKIIKKYNNYAIKRKIKIYPFVLPHITKIDEKYPRVKNFPARQYNLLCKNDERNTAFDKLIKMDWEKFDTEFLKENFYNYEDTNIIGRIQNEYKRIK